MSKTRPGLDTEKQNSQQLGKANAHPDLGSIQTSSAHNSQEREQLNFTAPSILKDHKFTSMEQYYQFMKARCLMFVEERFTRFNGKLLSSRRMTNLILVIDDPNIIVEVGTSFDDLESKDSEWRKKFEMLWMGVVQRMLGCGHLLKFEADGKLGHKLLKKTGEIELKRLRDAYTE